MGYKTLNVGNGSYVVSSNIDSILPLSGKRLMTEITARKAANPQEKVMLHDCANGKPRKSVVILKDGSYYMSFLTVKTLLKRLNKSNDEI